MWYEIVAYIAASTPLATSMSLKPADLHSTKAKILVPFLILAVLRRTGYMPEIATLRIDVFLRLFSLCVRTGCKLLKIFILILAIR